MQSIKANQKTIVIVTIAIILALGAGFWVWKKQVNWITSQDQIKKEEIAKTNTDVTDTSDTFDWKTYRNDQYGIEFKYPENMLYVNDGVDSAEVFHMDIIQNGRQGKDINKPGWMRITLNSFADQKYGVAKEQGLCESVDVFGKRGEVCDEKKSDKGKAKESFLTFVQKGICFQNVSVIFFEPKYSNNDAFGMNSIGILCDKDDQKITMVFQKIYQSIHFDNQ
jgi:hypothetical protein